MEKKDKMIENLKEYDHTLLTRISFQLTLWKCNGCHKIYRTEQGCANHAVKEQRLKEKEALEK